MNAAPRSLVALAFAFAATGAVAAAAPGGAAAPGCVASLRDVHAVVGTSSFTSHYVTVDGYGYGEFKTGSLGGQSLWRKTGTLWCRVQTGAAVLDRSAIVGFGVPPATADRLLAAMRGAGPELAPPKPPAPPAVPRHP
jgi:hypothetical protein